MRQLTPALLLWLGLLVGCAPAAPSIQPADSIHLSPRPRPEIPTDWPAGKRIVMHVTPGLDRSFVSACDMPVPALSYLKRGHTITILVDQDAVTSYRRDASGRTPLDKLDMLEEDKDELATWLGVPRAEVPRNFGALYQELARRGVRIVANEDALRAHNIDRQDLDPIVEVVSAAEARRLTQDLDALLPYDDIGPMHSIFAHRVDQQEPHQSGH